MRWPIIDLMLVMGISPARSPKTRLTALVSIESFSLVLVPWAEM